MCEVNNEELYSGFGKGPEVSIKTQCVCVELKESIADKKEELNLCSGSWM